MVCSSNFNYQTPLSPLKTDPRSEPVLTKERKSCHFLGDRDSETEREEKDGPNYRTVSSDITGLMVDGEERSRSGRGRTSG